MAEKSNEPSALVWLAPVGMLIAVAVAGRLVLAPPEDLAWIVVGALVVGALGWIVVSALWPARADRGCPECGADAVRRIDRGTTHGIVCDACQWRDETASGWLLAEEDGPLEMIVLEERGRTKSAASLRAPELEVEARTKS